MHHAPAGPPLFARVAGLLARLRFRVAGPLAALGALVAIVRRTRVVPVALGALVLMAFALAAPIAPYDDDAASTAALDSTSDGGQELVPATGDGWTQDGVPAETSPADEESKSASSPSRSAPGSSSGSSSAAVEATDATAAGTSTRSSTPSSSSAASSARTSSSGTASASASRTKSSPSSSSRTSSSSSDEPESPSATHSAPSETEAPSTLDPADEVLAAVNDARTAAGCTALTPDADLASLAAEHSAAMRDDDFVAVRSPDGGSPLNRGGRTAVVAEGSDPAEVADDWLDDATLLDCSLTRGGVGTTGGYWTFLAA